MIAKIEICMDCGKEFISGGIFPLNKCEQCSMSNPIKVWSVELDKIKLDENSWKNHISEYVKNIRLSFYKNNY